MFCVQFWAAGLRHAQRRFSPLICALCKAILSGLQTCIVSSWPCASAFRHTSTVRHSTWEPCWKISQNDWSRASDATSKSKINHLWATLFPKERVEVQNDPSMVKKSCALFKGCNLQAISQAWSYDACQASQNAFHIHCNVEVFLSTLLKQANKVISTLTQSVQFGQAYPTASA